ncbi:MAG: hypothetical protein D6775_06715, partial [Caldilineae bacterium]
LLGVAVGFTAENAEFAEVSCGFSLLSALSATSAVEKCDGLPLTTLVGEPTKLQIVGFNHFS